MMNMAMATTATTTTTSSLALAILLVLCHLIMHQEAPGVLLERVFSYA
jgi:hypothetical protein